MTSVFYVRQEYTQKKSRAPLKISLCFAGKFYIKQQNNNFPFVVTISTAKYSELEVLKNKTDSSNKISSYILSAEINFSAM